MASPRRIIISGWYGVHKVSFKDKGINVEIKKQGDKTQVKISRVIEGPKKHVSSYHNAYSIQNVLYKLHIRGAGGGNRMPGRNVQYFTEKEQEFTHLLIGIGFPRTVAKVLVFLGNTPEATSRDIERGADLRQPEVSIAMQYLHEQGWIASRLVRTNSIGRPQNLIYLSRPIAEIIDHIQSEKEGEIRKKMALTQKIRNYVTPV